MNQFLFQKYYAVAKFRFPLVFERYFGSLVGVV